MHNNKKHDGSSLEKDDMIYIRKEDIDNGITYGAFNNMNENEEYTKDKPKAAPAAKTTTAAKSTAPAKEVKK